MGDNVDFLPADKNRSFQQDDSITLDVCNQTCPKHQKQQVYSIFAISQEKCEGCKYFLQSDTIILCVCSQTCPNYPK